MRQIAPYAITVSGLPGGLVFQNGNVAGTPSAAGMYTVSVTAIDAVGASAAANLSLTIDPPSGNYTIPDESKGKISAIGAGYLMVGSKKLIWNSSTLIIVNTPNGELHVIDTFVKAGMKVQWKGLRDASTNTVLTSQLEVN